VVDPGFAQKGDRGERADREPMQGVLWVLARHSKGPPRPNTAIPKVGLGIGIGLGSGSGSGSWLGLAVPFGMVALPYSGPELVWATEVPQMLNDIFCIINFSRNGNLGNDKIENGEVGNGEMGSQGLLCSADEDDCGRGGARGRPGAHGVDRVHRFVGVSLTSKLLCC